MPDDAAFEEEDAYHIDDDDGGTDSDGDICERCECTRETHEASKGACTVCDRCRKFKEL
jgi:hypothetical protein